MGKMIAVITGGMGGIGTAICRRLIDDYQIIACYFMHGDHEKARRLQRAELEAGFAVDILYADVSNFAECNKLTTLVMERYGQIDLLVNNAGITADSSLKNMTPEQWQAVIDANLTGVFNMTRNVLPGMLARSYGRIISIASINGRKGQFGQCNYAASKAALYGFTKSLALEVASHGITVNTVSPGYIDTGMLAGLNQDILNSIIANIPVGRLGKASEVADAVAFLASPASSFITGANLDVNGGQYMS